MFANLLVLFSRTFWQPFSDPRRAATLLGSAIGLMGFTLANFASGIDYAQAGAFYIFAYFAVLFIGGDFLYAPLIYLGFSSLDGRAWRIGMVIAQLAGFAVFMQLGYHSIWRGFFTCLISPPFFCLYHIAMVQRTTDNNRGYEVALTGFLSLLAGIGALIVGGLCLSHQLPQMANLIALLCLLSGTVGLLWATSVTPRTSIYAFMAEARRVLEISPYLIRRIMALATMEMPHFFMAGFLTMLGYPPAETLSLIGARIILSFILTPVVGRLIHGDTPSGFAKGMVMIAIAWVGLTAIPTSPVIVLLFLLLFGFGLNIISASGHVGWYQMKTYPPMMWHGVFITLGRMCMLCLLIPLLYFDPQLYMLGVAAIACIMVLLNRRWRRLYPQET